MIVVVRHLNGALHHHINYDAPQATSSVPVATNPQLKRSTTPTRRALCPESWSWVEGEPADQMPITRTESAEVLAEFLSALHQQAPADAPANPTRGIPLAGVMETDDDWFQVIADYANADAAHEVWQKAVAAPAWQGAALWLHGDLHPANVIVRDGALAGVIDFGEMCAGDPATDLSAAWILLPAGAAQRFFDAYDDVDEATIERARGWAVLRALGLIGIGQNGRLGLPGGKATWEPAGYATLERVLAAS
ncbi:MAG TPA: phosphotransferase [Dermatophilaceae bacterium]